MADLATLILDADTKGLKRAEQDLKGVTDTASRTAQDVGRSMQRVGAGLTAGVTVPLALFGKSSFDAAIQSREAFAQVESALASMGGASGRTAEQLQASAKQLETFSNFDDDDILQKVTANLLTFGNVAGTEFDRAQQAAVDLSARLGQDLQSSTIMLGKALNDPIAGISAMSRVGVQFTDDQEAMVKAMVEAGDVAGAQGLILGELERQYGGAARAAREAAPGGDLNQAWRTLQETIGERLVVAFEKLEAVVAPVINAFLSMPAEVQTVVVVIGALAAVIGPLLVVLGTLVTLAPAIATGIGLIKVAFMGLLANPIFLGAAAAITAIYVAWQYWDEIKAIVAGVGQAISDWFSNNVQPAFDGAMAAIEPLVQFFKDTFAVAIGGPLEIVSNLLRGDFSGAWDAAKAMVDNAVKAVLKFVASFAPETAKYLFNLYTVIKSKFAEIVHNMVQMGRDMINGLVNGIKDNASAVWNAIKGVVSGAIDWAKDLLGIASPSKVFAEIGLFVAEGFAEGLVKGKGKAKDAMRELAQETVSLMRELFPELARMRKQFEDLALLDSAAKNGIISLDALKEARLRLLGARDEVPISEALINAPAIEIEALKAGRSFEKLGDTTELQTVRIKENFKDMAEGVLNALRNLSQSIKSGDFLDILSGVLDLFLQIGATGAFGEKLASNIKGARADGGAVSAGGTYLVGERGPELFSPATNGQIVPNHNMRGNGMVINVDARGSTDPEAVRQQVERGILEAAPAIVAAAQNRTIATLRRPKLAGAL